MLSMFSFNNVKVDFYYLRFEDDYGLPIIPRTGFTVDEQGKCMLIRYVEIKQEELEL